eukprot:GILI01015046.1.p1 GENE.GILI01015046.1~~GILI01015046.1.p1  ORF type:complete len:504 (-),score=165.34 GILI01015046.1:161-1618(-)
MLVNLLRVQDADPEFLIRKSFHQFQHDRQLPKLEQQLGSLEEQQRALVIESEDSVADYYQLRQQIDKVRESMRAVVHRPEHVLPFLQVGRLVRVRESGQDWGWGVVTNFQKRLTDKKPSSAFQLGGAAGAAASLEQVEARYVVDVLLHCRLLPGQEKPSPCPLEEKGEMQVVPCALELLDGVSSVRVYIPKDLRPAENRLGVLKSLREVRKRFPDGVPLLDPVADMAIKDEQLEKDIAKADALEQKLSDNPLHKSPQLPALYEQFSQKVKLEAEIRTLKQQMIPAREMVLKDDLKAKSRVLRRLGFINTENIVQLKGRVACEISTADELVVTELMFNGVFNEMEVDHIVALLSCLVFEERSDDQPRLREELEGPFRQLQETARRIAQVSQESKLEIDVEEYVNKFKPTLVELTLQWCQGAKFADLCKLTDVFEGTIIRCFRRLEELLRQLAVAAKTIGNTELEQKFEEGIKKIKRGIVFAASLYL